MSKDFAKAYDPKDVENKIYRRWEASGFFNPDNLPPINADQDADRRRSIRVDQRTSAFCMVMPPPNANGALHIGHAVFVTLQDILIRFWRMRGRKALWLPGADHAGFETQVVFDKKLEKEGRNRADVPRDQLYEEMLTFTQKNKKVMEGQLRKLGASCDWSREKFTLDSDIVRTVTDTFIKLYAEGLLYRGERIVNWCVKHQTTLSDLEVKYEERTDPLYFIQYGPFEIATVRPETKFGDKYVVMHPKDKRYARYKDGEQFAVEWINRRITATVIKDSVIDMKFGTGAMTITPWHDAMDYELALRRKLDKEPIIDRYGRLLPVAGEFAGMKINEARPKIVKKLKEKELLTRIESNYKHSVAVCYKCGNPVEPVVMPQWFINMKPLAEKAIAAVRSGKIRIIPERYKKVYFHWLKNIRDWNISRQIIWGIRIPAWYCVGCGDVRMNPNVSGNWFFVRHGETDWNVKRRIQGQSGVAPLNRKGREQAHRAADQLKTQNIDLIISSDLQRARETAEIIGNKLGVEVSFDPALRERNYGAYEGKMADEIDRSVRRAWVDDAEFGENGVESMVALQGRIHRALLRHRARHAHKNVVIVSHGASLRSLLARLRNTTPMEVGALHNASIVHFSTDGICQRCGSEFIEQDPDVLDTWFSSGQWPFATLMADRSKSKINLRVPSLRSREDQKSKSDFEVFYPTDVMETGYDILFFWVARMIMLGLWRTGTVPFRTVYLHGLVRDKDRQKMSKSKGNVINPLGVAEFYGTDAVRMALTVGNLAGQDIVISEEKIRGYRNFANKLWNIHRFIVMRTKDERRRTKAVYSAEDKKRLAELKALVKRVTSDLERFRFHHAAEVLYHYTWHTFADKIIESVKPRLASEDPRKRAAVSSLLLEIHSTLLKLLHPFMPFITEELWSHLPGANLRPDLPSVRLRAEDRLREGQRTKADLLMVERWPV